MPVENAMVWLDNASRSAQVARWYVEGLFRRIKEDANERHQA